jgi:hypothetical protein
LRPNLFRIDRLLVLLALAGNGACILQGGTGELELDAPTVEVSLELDKSEYKLGEPVIATINTKNAGEKLAVLAVPGRETVEIHARPQGGGPDADVIVEFISSPDDQFSSESVEAGESVSRDLLLHRFTREPGVYEVFVRYRTDDVAITAIGEDTSELVTVTVSNEVAFVRDRQGRISDLDAQRVARAFFAAAPDAAAESMLATDEARFEVAAVDGKPKQRTALVSPYTGKVKREINTTVAAERAKRR